MKIITSDVVKHEILLASTKNKSDVIEKALELLRQLPKYHVLVVRTVQELLRAMKNQFDITVIPSAAEPIILNSWTIQSQLASITATAELALGPGFDTRKVTKAVVEVAMNSKRPIDVRGLRNTSAHMFRPAAVAEVDLTMLIKARQRKTRGHPWQMGEENIQNDHVLLAHGPVASSFDVERAGYCTALVGLDGLKWWMTPKGPWERSRKHYGVYGDRFVGYEDGISVFELDVGVGLYVYPL